MDALTYVMSLYAIVGAQFIAAIACMLWLYRIMPREIEQKYSYLVRLQCKLPVPSGWREKIASNDIPIFAQYRRVVGAFYLFLAITIGLELVLWVWYSKNLSE